jgi:hypothetical protein
MSQQSPAAASAAAQGPSSILSSLGPQPTKLQKQKRQAAAASVATTTQSSSKSPDVVADDAAINLIPFNLGVPEDAWDSMAPPALPKPFKYPETLSLQAVNRFAINLDVASLPAFSALNTAPWPQNLTNAVVAHALYPYIYHMKCEPDETLVSMLTEQMKMIFGEAPFVLYEFREKLGIVPRKPRVPFFDIPENDLVLFDGLPFFVGQWVTRGPQFPYPHSVEDKFAEGCDPTDSSRPASGIVVNVYDVDGVAKVRFPYWTEETNKEDGCEQGAEVLVCIGTNACYEVVPRAKMVHDWPSVKESADRYMEIDMVMEPYIRDVRLNTLLADMEARSAFRPRHAVPAAAATAAATAAVPSPTATAPTPRSIPGVRSAGQHLSAQMQEALAAELARADAAVLPPEEDEGAEQPTSQPAAANTGGKRSRDGPDSLSLLSRKRAAEGGYTTKLHAPRWSASQITAADRLRLAKDAHWVDTTSAAIAAAANKVEAKAPNPIYVPYTVLAAALGYEHGADIDDAQKANDAKDVQFFDPHDRYFDITSDAFSVAWRCTHFTSVDALVAGTSPFRRRFLIAACRVFVVRDYSTTWVLCSNRSDPQDKSTSIKSRCTFSDARPINKAMQHPKYAVQEEKMWLVQTLAKAPTSTYNGRSYPDPEIAQLIDSIGDVKEYVVPETSSWWKALASTPHTKQNFNHVCGVDTRQILSTKFPKEVDHSTLHAALLEAKIEGRITRWGTILSPSMTTDAERIFKKLGGDLPREQQARMVKQRADKKAKEIAERVAKGAAEKEKIAAEKKAAEAKRQAEIDRLPAKIVVTTYSHPYLPLRFADLIASELKKASHDGKPFESKLLFTDVQSMTFAVSSECALRFDGQTLRPDEYKKMFLKVGIDNSLFFRSKFGEDASDATRAVVDDEQVRRDAAVLAGEGAEAQPASTPQGGDNE